MIKVQIRNAIALTLASLALASADDSCYIKTELRDQTGTQTCPSGYVEWLNGCYETS